MEMALQLQDYTFPLRVSHPVRAELTLVQELDLRWLPVSQDSTQISTKMGYLSDMPTEVVT